MPTRSLPHFAHSPIGKTTHKKGMSYAHVNYITRDDACSKTLAQNMPDDRSGARPYFQHEAGKEGVAVNALWPRTVIATDAINMIAGVSIAECRKPEIVADAAHAILTTPSRECNGRFVIDEDILRERGITDFSGYAMDDSQSLLPDLFLD